MSRKHFIAIAAALAATRPEREDFTTTSAVGNNTMFNGISYEAAYKQWATTRNRLVGLFFDFNDLFDGDRFIAATEV